MQNDVIGLAPIHVEGVYQTFSIRGVLRTKLRTDPARSFPLPLWERGGGEGLLIDLPIPRLIPRKRDLLTVR
jgi:hypothetical protein